MKSETVLKLVIDHIASADQAIKVPQMVKLGMKFQSLMHDGSIELVNDLKNASYSGIIYVERNGEITNASVG